MQLEKAGRIVRSQCRLWPWRRNSLGAARRRCAMEWAQWWLRGSQYTIHPHGGKEVRLPPSHTQSSKTLTDFPGGAEDRDLLAKAGDTKLDPQPGKIPRATEQLSPRATTTEPVLCNKRSHCSEKPTPCNKEKLWFTATRESPHKAVKTPAQPRR